MEVAVDRRTEPTAHLSRSLLFAISESGQVHASSFSKLVSDGELATGLPNGPGGTEDIANEGLEASEDRIDRQSISDDADLSIWIGSSYLEVGEKTFSREYPSSKGWIPIGNRDLAARRAGVLDVRYLPIKFASTIGTKKYGSMDRSVILSQVPWLIRFLDDTSIAVYWRLANKRGVTRVLFSADHGMLPVDMTAWRIPPSAAVELDGEESLTLLAKHARVTASNEVAWSRADAVDGPWQLNTSRMVYVAPFNPIEHRLAVRATATYTVSDKLAPELTFRPTIGNVLSPHAAAN